MLDDSNLNNAEVRKVLLDVADAAQNEIPDNVFDEHDIQFFLTKFAEYEQIRDGIPDAPADYSRFDLTATAPPVAPATFPSLTWTSTTRHSTPPCQCCPVRTS